MHIKLSSFSKTVIITMILLLFNYEHLYADCSHGVLQGNGTVDSPFLIATEDDLRHATKEKPIESELIYFLQTTDISVNTSKFIMNGNSVYDGGGYTINITNNLNAGGHLFSMSVKENQVVKNLVIGSNNARFEGIANSNNGLIESVTITGQALCNTSSGGPFVSFNTETGVIRNARFEGTYKSVTYCDATGGLVGRNLGLIENSSVKGSFYGQGHSYAADEDDRDPIHLQGGIVGVNTSTGKIRNSYVEPSTFELTDYAGLRLGGIAGGMLSGTIENSYSLGVSIVPNEYSSSKESLGIVGEYMGGTVRNTYYSDKAKEGIAQYTKLSSSSEWGQFVGYLSAGTERYSLTQFKDPNLVGLLNAKQSPLVWKPGAAPYPYPIHIGNVGLDVNVETAEIGDNTSAILAVEATSNVDRVQCGDSKGNIFYTGKPSSKILLNNLKEGLNTVACSVVDLSGNILYQHPKALKINKVNVLANVISELMAPHQSSIFVLVDPERHFDNNSANQALISEIVRLDGNLFFVGKMADVFRPLLKVN